MSTKPRGGGVMSNYLEVDSKILEKNLLLKDDTADADNFESFLRSPQEYMQDNATWKLATPTAGFCVKTTDSRSKKVFVNICKLDDIPEPRDITEEELMEMWQSDNVPDYRIPLSIQEPHDEFDKSGNPTIAYDVALNTQFFQKVKSNMVFRSFVMQVVLEGIEHKYDVELNKEDYIILQNRKSLGELKAHRIRKSKGGSYRPLIQELDSTPSGSGDSTKDSKKMPRFRLYENPKNNVVVGEFHFPVLVTPEELTLNMNENRIVIDHRRSSYFADFFIPVKVDDAQTTASFNLITNTLTVNMPLISPCA